MKNNSNVAKWREIQDEALDLESQHVGRTELFNEMEEMYFLEPADKGKLGRLGDNTKVTISPDPANQLDGAVRLMTATDPKFKVSQEIPDRDNIEDFADAMWRGSGRISGIPAHYDAILSALLYGETHMGVTSMRKMAEFTKDKVNARMAQQAMMQTPYMFPVWSPRDCYARYGRLGLTGHLRKTSMSVRDLRYDWGEQVDSVLGHKNNRDKVDYYEWWDTEYQAAWVGGCASPILCKPHDLAFLPIVHCLTEGSSALFSDTSKQLRPFLYKVAKSGLWKRDNLLMTVFFTIIFGIGGNPMYKFRSPSGRQYDVDWSQPGGVINLGQGEEFDSLIKNAIDPSIIQGKQMIDEKMADSTMYKQALGQPLGGSSPYSLVALLSQSGRLPLVSPQQRLGWMIARAMWVAFMWMKEEGKTKAKSGKYGKAIEFDPAAIGDDFDIDVELDIKLPQDQLGLANVANLLTQSGLVSQEWIRSEVLNIGNNEKMSESVLRERFTGMLAEFLSQQMIAQQQQPPPQQPPATGGLPPEMMAGGMQGPEPLPGEAPQNGMM